MPSIDVATNFYLVLTLVADAVVSVALLLALGALVSKSFRATVVGIAGAIAPQATVLAWLVALVTTTGSLYYSEHAGFIPCQLCWYQRILMYPLVIILLVAWLRKDRKVWMTVVPFVVIGAGAGLRREQLLLVGGALHLAMVREARVRHARLDGDERIPADRNPDGVPDRWEQDGCRRRGVRAPRRARRRR
jgi:disulfide bond formation protein DsbB